MSNTVDQFLLVKNGILEFFEGDLDDYEKVLLSNSESGSKTTEVKPEKVNKKEIRQQAADRRNELKPLRDRIKRLEREMEKLQSALQAIEEKLADTTLYEDDRKDELNDVLFDRARFAASLQEVEGEWLEKSQELEGLE